MGRKGKVKPKYRRPSTKPQRNIVEILNTYCFKNLKYLACVALLIVCYIYTFNYGKTYNTTKQVAFFMILCLAIILRVVIFESILIILKTMYLAFASKKFPDDIFRPVRQKDLTNLERIEYHLQYLHDKLNMKNSSALAPIIYERRTFYYNRLIYEFFLLVIPTVILSILLIDAKNEQAYQSRAAISNLISYESLRNFTSRTKFSSISNDIYSYLSHTCLPALHGLLNADGRTAREQFVRHNMGKLYGKIRLRQQRHKPIPGCPYPLNERAEIEYNHRCAKFYDSLEWDTQSYSYRWAPAMQDMLNDSYLPEMPVLREPFQYSPASRTKAIPISTRHHTYDGGGYTIGLGQTVANTKNIVSYLQTAHWIDNQTMVLFVEFNIININMNFILVNTIIIEECLAGEIESYLQTRIIRLSILARNIDWSILFWLLICFIAIIWYIFHLFKRILLSISQLFSNFWNIMDILIISMLFGIAVIYFRRDAAITKLLDVYEHEIAFVYFPLNSLATYEVLIFTLAGFCIFIAIIRLWRSLQFSIIFRIFTNTVDKAKWALINTAVNIIIFSIAFTLVIGLLTGSDVELLHDIVKGVPAILSSTYNVSGQNRFQDAFYAALLGITTIYFVNMFIVCLLYYFEVSKNELNYENEYVTYSFFRFLRYKFFDTIQICLNGIWIANVFVNTHTRTRIARLRGGGNLISRATRDWTSKKKHDKIEKTEIIENQFRNPTPEKYNISEQILDTQFLYLKTYLDDEMMDCHVGHEKFLDFFQETLGAAVVRDDPVEMKEYIIQRLVPRDPIC